MSPGHATANNSIISGMVIIDSTCERSANSAAGCVSTPYGAGAKTAVKPDGMDITQIPHIKKLGVIKAFCG